MKAKLKKNTEIFNKLFCIPNNWQNVLYVHTPFCLQKCKYCIYASIIPRGKEQIKNFFYRILPQQVDQYREILENLTFDQVYFGGGTPSIADPEILDKVYNYIPNFKDIPIKMTESSPYTITDDHIDLYHKYGFKYVSMGIQTLSPQVLKKQNRLCVSMEKLEYLVQRLNNLSFISNIDLIFFLDTGRLEDLAQCKKDMDIALGQLRPISITIHSDYYADKSLPKQEAMLELIDEMINRYPEYSCVNSCLEKNDANFDMVNGAEYRLMRDLKDFHFHMICKIPGSPCYGYNVLAIGAYDTFIPESNYFYILDFMDKYAYREVLKRNHDIFLDFLETRKLNGLKYPEYYTPDNFFKDISSEINFKEVLKEYRLPYLNFNKKNRFK